MVQTRNFSLSLIVLCAFAAGALAACGSSKGAGYDSAYQAGTQNCSDAFVTEVQNMGNLDQMTNDELKAARPKIVAFADKYKGVACKLNEDGKDVSFDVSDRAKKALAMIDQKLGAGNAGNAGGAGMGAAGAGNGF
jgi:hypothetical protein